MINPYAGLGGAVGLKGSDGADIVRQALSRGASLQAGKRAGVAMSKIVSLENALFYTAAGAMGEDLLVSLKLPCEVVYRGESSSSAEDTKKTIQRFIELNVDLVVFAGGDGTARDVLDAFSSATTNETEATIPVIGIPAGVKMHSAVYAVSPGMAGELIELILSGDAMSLVEAQVMDLDEAAFRDGRVNASCYGYLTIPVDDTRMQLIKQGGLNNHDIAVQDIVAEITENMEPEVFYLMGSGSTTAEIMNQLGLENTLLGVDIVRNEQLIASDVDEQGILDIIQRSPAKIVLTVIGGQGHLFGRGNQQLSASVIKRVINSAKDDAVSKDNIIIVATNEKLRSLNKRPMIADTGDSDLDNQLSGLYAVTTGYQQKTLYRLN